MIYLNALWTFLGVLISGGLLSIAHEVYKNRCQTEEKLKSESLRKVELDRSYDYYNYKTIDDKYFLYLNLIVQYPELGCSQYSEPVKGLSPTEIARRNAIIEMHFSVFETAYIGRNVTSENYNRRWPPGNNI